MQKQSLHVLAHDREMTPARQYWEQQVRRFPEAGRLPGRFPVSSATGQVGRLAIDFEPDTVSRLNALTKGSPFLTYTALVAATMVCLRTYTRSRYVVVGSPPRRPAPVGHMLPIGLRLPCAMSFKELLLLVREALLHAYEHQTYPLYTLLPEVTGGQPDDPRAPFDVEIACSEIHERVSTPGRAVTAVLRTAGDTLSGEVVFDESPHARFTAESLLAHVQYVLKQGLKDVGTPLGNLTLMGQEEQRQRIEASRGERQGVGMNESMHEMFEEQVRRTPDSIAVTAGEEQVTYAEIDRRSAQLGDRLRQRKQPSAALVAILLDRSVDLIVAMLAALRTGNAYLLLDSHMPQDRVVGILDASKACVVLTSDKLAREFRFGMLQKLQHASHRSRLSAPRPAIQDLDALPYPDRRLIDERKYEQHIAQGYVQKSVSILGSRGCPYGCAYCHRIWPKKHVRRSAQNLFEEIQFHYDRGYRSFSFLDDVFNLDRANSQKLFGMIIDRRLDVRLLFPNGMRGDLLDPAYIDLMVEAGVIEVSLALETASTRLQHLIGKRLDVAKLRENIEYFCRRHPQVMLDLFAMFGFPSETEEEAMLTLEFVRSIEWLHFPYLFSLRIFPSSDMARLAMQHGISEEAIDRSCDLAYHELGETLPYSTRFAREYQRQFVDGYFLLPRRLEHVLPIQSKVLTHEEMVAKYKSYLPGDLVNYPIIAEYLRTCQDFYPEGPAVRGLSPVMPDHGSGRGAGGQAPLRILLLDLSQHFSPERDQLREMVEAPLGLMSLLSYANHKYGARIEGRIAKSMVDFDSYAELEAIVEQCRPDVIGIRSLSFFRDFFHRTLCHIKRWLPDVPIVAGGPYATSEWETVLADPAVDVAVLGEGEETFAELIGRMLENGGQMPGQEELNKIPGLAFVPEEQRSARAASARTVVFVEEMAKAHDVEAGDRRRPGVHPEQPAYVIYTSGSTGEPKGVLVSQRALVNHMRWMQSTFPLGGNDRVLQKTPLSFDAAVWEFYAPLISGAQLILPEGRGHPDPTSLIDEIRTRDVTVLQLVPSYLSILLDEPGVGRCQSLRRIFSGGEPLQVETRNRLVGQMQATLHNLYGPAEACIDATYWSDDTRQRYEVIPIGRPIANTMAYVLDDAFQPVPAGIPGEICIAGSGLAQGYLGSPEMTASRFVPDPFAALPGGRLYCTGDIGRQMPRGDLLFLGREDHQVKIRGCRVELAECEAALRRHPNVRECAVVAAERTPGQKELVAYMVLSDPREQTGEEAGPFLSTRVPTYMVPSSFVALEALPRGPGGKIDRQALSRAACSNGDRPHGRMLPRTPQEKQLADIWSSLLRVPEVGIDDDFFELGGNSLHVIQLVSRVRDLFQVTLPFESLFGHLTVTLLDRQITAMQENHRTC